VEERRREMKKIVWLGRGKDVSLIERDGVESGETGIWSSRYSAMAKRCWRIGQAREREVHG